VPNYSAFKDGIIRSNPLAFPRASGKNADHVVEFACRNAKGQREILRGCAGWRGLRSVGYRGAKASPHIDTDAADTAARYRREEINAAFLERRYKWNNGGRIPQSRDCELTLNVQFFRVE
jgi:hypothetical protein